MTTAAAAVIAKARRDIVSHFMTADAISRDKAVGYEPDRRVRRRQFERMVDAGVLHEAEPGRYWIDVPRFDEWSRSRRKRIGIAVIGASLAAAAIALIGA